MFSARLRSRRWLLIVSVAYFWICDAPIAYCEAADGKVSELNAESLRASKVLGDPRFKHAADLTHITRIDGGRRLLTSARDGTARLWDANTGEELRRFSHPGGEDIWNLQVLPGERELLTCGEDKHVTRWDLATGKQLGRYDLGATVFRIAVLPGGKQFVATTKNKLVVQWDIATGKKVRTFKGHTDDVYTATINPAGTRMVSAGDDDTLRIWNLKTGDSVFKSADLDGSIFTAVYASDGRRLVTCGSDGVRMWDADGKILWHSKFKQSVRVGAWSPDGKTIAVTCDDDDLYILAADTGKTIKSISAPGREHWPVTFTKDGTKLLSGGDRSLYHWSVKGGGRERLPAKSLPMFRDGIQSFCVSPDGRRAYVASAENDLQAWDIVSGRPVMKVKTSGKVQSLRVSRDGKRLLASLDDDAGMNVFDTSGKSLAKISSSSDLDAVFVAGDKQIVAGGADGKPAVFDASTGRQLRALSGKTDGIRQLTASSDGMWVAAVTTEGQGKIRMWSVSTGKELAEIDKPPKQLKRLLIMPGNGALLAGGDNEIHCWQAIKPPSSPLSKDAVAALVAKLASDRFVEREKAQQALISGGAAAVALLPDSPVTDPEVSTRLEHIRQVVSKSQLTTRPLGLPLKSERDWGAMSGHPDGRHFAVIEGTDADAQIVIGEITATGLREVRRIGDGHSPSSIQFSQDGRRLLTGNRDGTVSVYETAP